MVIVPPVAVKNKLGIADSSLEFTTTHPCVASTYTKVLDSLFTSKVALSVPPSILDPFLAIVILFVAAVPA